MNQEVTYGSVQCPNTEYNTQKAASTGESNSSIIGQGIQRREADVAP